MSPQQPQDIPRGMEMAKQFGREIPAADRRVNTNLVGFRPKEKRPEVSFVKHQGRRNKNHKPGKRHHQTRMTFQEMAFHKDADSLKEEIDHHCAK